MPPRTPDSVLTPYHDRLGREPDHLIAQEAGVSRALIIAYRKRMGIPAYEGYKFGQAGNPVAPKPSTPVAAAAPPAPVEKASASFRGRRSALDPFADMLGRVPDSEIARMAGVTPENVRTYRARRGIAAVWQGGADVATPVPVARPTPAPVAAPVVEAPSGETLRTVYAINIDKAGVATSYAIIATDFADAARCAVTQVARHQPGATIRAIQRIAELLE